MCFSLAIDQTKQDTVVKYSNMLGTLEFLNLFIYRTSGNNPYYYFMKYLKLALLIPAMIACQPKNQSANTVSHEAVDTINREIQIKYPDLIADIIELSEEDFGGNRDGPHQPDSLLGNEPAKRPCVLPLLRSGTSRCGEANHTIYVAAVNDEYPFYRYDYAPKKN